MSFRRRFTYPLVAAAVVVAAVLPAVQATAAPTIEFLNPSDYRQPQIVSDEFDANNAIHLVVWAGEVPSSAQVEFEIEQGITTTTLVGTRGGNDSWSADFVPTGFTDGQVIMRAILYNGTTEVARTPDEVITIDTGTPPPQQNTVEITHPVNGGPLGFVTPKDKATNTVVRGIVSADTPQVRVLYTKSAPGTDPEWIGCGGDPASSGTFATRCTLESGDSPNSVTAVAAVANTTPPPAEPSAAADQTGDAHRAVPYLQTPTTVQMAPEAIRVEPGRCQALTATVLDQSGQPMAAMNVDVHAQGPDDQLRFAAQLNVNSGFKHPDKGHGGNELAAKCEPTDQELRQGEHSVPVADDIKHIESTTGTNNLGQFTFVLRSATVGGTQISAWPDVDDDDLRGNSEPGGIARIGWGEDPPPPQEEISIDPPTATATVGNCQVFTITVRAGNSPVPAANVDVHISNPTGVSFCSGPLRAPDSGGHTTDSHADGTRHGEAETDGNGAIQFGVSATSEGETSISAWLDKTDDDALSGEAATGASVTWQQVGERSISLNSSRRSVRKGRRVRLFGSIEAAASCASAQQVRLQSKRPRGGAFRTIARRQTDGQGDYSFRVRVRRTLKYRAVTPRNGVCDLARSNIRTVRARR